MVYPHQHIPRQRATPMPVDLVLRFLVKLKERAKQDTWKPAKARHLNRNRDVMQHRFTEGTINIGEDFLYMYEPNATTDPRLVIAAPHAPPEVISEVREIYRIIRDRPYQLMESLMIEFDTISEDEEDPDQDDDIDDDDEEVDA